MKWRKLGFVFCGGGESQDMQTHARAPVAWHLHDDIFRIFFGSCDMQMRSQIFSLNMRISTEPKIDELQSTPCIKFGNKGFYDDNGISPSWIATHRDVVYMYTIGYSVKNMILFDASTGLAISSDGGVSFDKINGPILTNNIIDPVFAASPSICIINNVWHMWYVSCERWVEEDLGSKHYYNIKHRISSDGICWGNTATKSIDFVNEHEYAIARPSVLYDHGIFKMWYCFREQPGISSYRIGYAESNDGDNWTRMDEKMRSFDVSESGWDSEMLCYPYVFDHAGERYMLYNGNGYGRTGFGLAVLEQD